MQATTASPTASLGRRTTAGIVVALLLLAAAAWTEVARGAGDMAGMASGLGHVGVRMPSDTGAVLFLASWVLMMAAMMLPTILPMVLAHRMVVRDRGGGHAPTAAFVGGYLLVWSAIGVVPTLLFAFLRGLSMETATGWWLSPTAGAVLVVAGAYQFTAWKSACLRACRTPLEFLISHDFGAGIRGALRAGVSHGAFCLGCCWALMSVLAVVGFMSLTWMIALSLVFLAEKNWRHGVLVTRVAGTAVVATGIAVIVSPDLLRTISAA